MSVKWISVLVLLLVMGGLGLGRLAGQEAFHVSSETGAGLRSTVFQTPQGKINVLMPEDMRIGDKLSGAIIPEPSGATAEELRRNTETLKRYSLEAGPTTASFIGSRHVATRRERQFTGSERSWRRTGGAEHAAGASAWR